MPIFKLVKGKPFRLITFPCQAGIKRKLVYNTREFAKVFNFVNKYSSKGMYNTIYSFDTILPTGKPYFNSARVDKLWNDIDLEDYDFDMFRCWLGMLSTHLFLEDNDIMHCILFTANGYHVYIGVDSSGVPSDKKNDYITTLADDLERVTGSIYCIATVTAPTARIARTIGSYYAKKTSKENAGNPKYHEYLAFLDSHGFSDRYCVSLSDADIHAGYMHVYRKSLARSFDVHLMGHYKIVMTSVRNVKKRIEYIVDPNKINEVKQIDDSAIKDVYSLLENFSIYDSDVPICVKTMLKNDELGYYERYALIVYLYDLDLTPTEISIVLRNVLSHKKYKHCMETAPPRSIVAKAQAGLYNVGCKTMRELGYCEEEKCQSKTLFPFMK